MYNLYPNVDDLINLIEEFEMENRISVLEKNAMNARIDSRFEDAEKKEAAVKWSTWG